MRIGSWLWRTPGRRWAVSSFGVASVVVVVVMSTGTVLPSSRSTFRATTPAAGSPSAVPTAPTEAGAAAAPSTFAILGYTDGFDGRERRGYAFVIRSARGSSFLLTDYLLVVSDYMAGGRTVDLQRGDQTFTATIVAVSPDPHVALLRVRGVYPVLTIAPGRLAAGSTVIVGEQGSRNAQPAAVLDHSGPAGDRHLAFSVEVSNDDDGKPVVNPADQVVGIAEPTSEHGMRGVGFAVPIWSACQAVPC